MIKRNKGKRWNRFVADYVIFDLETTGVRQGVDEIIEISALHISNGEVLDEFSTLVHPSISISPEASAVNGITDEMVRDVPSIAEAMEGFLAFIQDRVLVGHNIHSFDMNFIYDAAMETFQKEINNDYVDTLFLSRKCLPHLAKHKLTDISQYFKISTAGAHRAMNDCIMNYKCFEEMGKLLASKNEDAAEDALVCPKCGCDLVKRKGQYGEFYGCGGFPDCRFTKRLP